MWDERYSETGFAYGTEENDFLRSQFNHIAKGGKVLCLAEGEGRNAVFLAKQGYLVTAVDQSLVGLEKAQKLATQCGVEINTVVADLAGYDFGKECWDAIISIAAHVPTALRQKIHHQVAPALKNEGVFILEAYTEKQLTMSGIGGPPASQKDLFMSLFQLKEELQGLSLVVANETERHINEGKYHQGESAVVQIVVCKNHRSV